MQDERDEPPAEGGGDSTTYCHCQGGRLLVLFGPLGYQMGRGIQTEISTGNRIVADEAMFNAQNWALGFYESQRRAGKHIHMLRYDAPASGAPNAPLQPDVPVSDPTSAETVAVGDGGHQDMPGWNWSWQPKSVPNLNQTLPNCCCFLTEVLLICHGGQGADVTFMTDTLASVIGGRPVERFVFWSCRSGRLFMPGDQAYQRICGVFRPSKCQCLCDVQVCNAFDPDGAQRHCPDGTKSTTIITSGQFNGRPTPVGLRQSTRPAAANPFVTPDGKVRIITVAPDNDPPSNDQATATIGPDGSPVPSLPIFGGAGIDPPVPPPPEDAAATADEIAHMSRSSAVQHRKIFYHGAFVHRGQCRAADGCIVGQTMSEPGWAPG
jgi:hypothetical protein